MRNELGWNRWSPPLSSFCKNKFVNRIFKYHPAQYLCTTSPQSFFLSCTCVVFLGERFQPCVDHFERRNVKQFGSLPPSQIMQEGSNWKDLFTRAFWSVFFVFFFCMPFAANAAQFNTKGKLSSFPLPRPLGGTRACPLPAQLFRKWGASGECPVPGGGSTSFWLFALHENVLPLIPRVLPSISE